jgi:hypothetical protein
MADASYRVPIVAKRGGRADLERATGRERGSPKKDEPDDMQAEPFDKLRTTLVEARIVCPSTGSGHSLG